jgi:hypothetical protein
MQQLRSREGEGVNDARRMDVVVAIMRTAEHVPANDDVAKGRVRQECV